LTDLAAAIGLAQLKKAERMWTRRRVMCERYMRNLAQQLAFELPSQSEYVEHSWHLYVILINRAVLGIDRDRLIDELRARGIGTSVHFIPLHLHPYYRDCWGYKAGQFPIAEDYSERCLSLPIYPAMTDDDVDRVSEALIDIAQKHRR
jgi:dTDP-4-amino-4,6-dideoxygalactose transaminase